ncbi:MAG: HIT domain-containing protein [Clostridiales bacterium]|jgi:histidine triad (HIT) family protein|nr:HIT domain-containing protein [Clostridiales bacterium]MDR2752435.1 HIT domain-containing protein [Clostridiales bacterium]
MKEDCIFCKIISGDIPSYKIYENDDVLVILDRFPTNQGECLVLTKEHYDTLFDLSPSAVAKAFAAASGVAAKIKQTLPIDGLNILQNNGEPAGQQIPHFHIHVIPRYDSDNLVIHGKGTDPAPEEFEAMVEKLKI